MLVRRLEMLPVECVARGYLSGGGTAEYERTGSIRDVVLPAGLVEGSQLPSPVFTPSTKAEIGEHDEPIDFPRVVSLVGAPRAEELRELTLALYRRGAEIARDAGIVLADTKFEFGPPAARWCWATRCSPPTRPASGPRRPGRRGRCSPRTTSSSCATG